MWVNVELWSCVAVSRWCFVYNMHQINIHNRFHKSTFFFKTVTERKIFFLVLSELFAFSCWSVITILYVLETSVLYVLETSAFSSGCFLTNVRFITWSGKTEGNWAQNSSLLYTCMLLHLCDPSPRKGYNVWFFFFFLCLEKLKVYFDFDLLKTAWAAVKTVRFLFLCYCFFDS